MKKAAILLAAVMLFSSSALYAADVSSPGFEVWKYGLTPILDGNLT